MRQLSGNAPLRRLVLLASAVMFIGGCSGAAVFAVVDQGLHRVPEFVGVLSAVQGAGSVAGGLLAGPLLSRMPTRHFVAVSVVLFAVSVLLRATPSLPVVLGASLLAGLSLPWTLIAIATSVQREVPSAYLGRVAGTVHTLTFAPNALGQAACAGLLVAVDYRLMLVVLGVAGLLTTIGCVWRFPHRRTPSVPDDEPADGPGSTEPTDQPAPAR
jgi:MFS family permease